MVKMLLDCFGVRKKGDKLFLGKIELFINDKIRVGDYDFNKTSGLMELLYKKAPNDKLITSADKTPIDIY